MLKKVILSLVLAILAVPLVVAAIALTRPAAFLVQRSVTIAASPDAVYQAVVDFNRWERWSPWAKLDPLQQTTITGHGLGAVYAWSGNKEVGAGRMTITEAIPGSKVGLRLEFLRPFASTSEASFLVVRDGAGSRLTWLMTGHNGFLGRAMSIVVDMDKLVGTEFEKGLALLKAEVERPAR